MEVKKRKTKTSTEVKRRYNEKTYSIISVQVKDIAKAFKQKCLSEGISHAQVIKTAIDNFLIYFMVLRHACRFLFRM